MQNSLVCAVILKTSAYLVALSGITGAAELGFIFGVQHLCVQPRRNVLFLAEEDE